MDLLGLYVLNQFGYGNLDYLYEYQDGRLVYEGYAPRGSDELDQVWVIRKHSWIGNEETSGKIVKAWTWQGRSLI